MKNGGAEGAAGFSLGGSKVELAMSRPRFLRVASYRSHQNKDTRTHLSMLQRRHTSWNGVSAKPSFWAGNKKRPSY